MSNGVRRSSQGIPCSLGLISLSVNRNWIFPVITKVAAIISDYKRRACVRACVHVGYCNCDVVWALSAP